MRNRILVAVAAATVAIAVMAGCSESVQTIRIDDSSLHHYHYKQKKVVKKKVVEHHHHHHYDTNVHVKNVQKGDTVHIVEHVDKHGTTHRHHHHHHHKNKKQRDKKQEDKN